MVPGEDLSHPFEILALVNIHDVYDERVEQGTDERDLPGSYAGAVFMEGDILDIVQGVFDAPVTEGCAKRFRHRFVES